MWHGDDLSTVEYFQYRIGGQVVTLPATPYLAKLADYGLTCKYSEPMVLESSVMKDGNAKYDSQSKIEVPLRPNFFSESYDLLSAIYGFYPYFMTPDIIASLAWIMGTTPNAINVALPTYMNLTVKRPVIKNLPIISPREFLLSCPVFDKYRRSLQDRVYS